MSEERFAALEARIAALEAENKALKAELGQTAARYGWEKPGGMGNSAGTNRLIDGLGMSPEATRRFASETNDGQRKDGWRR